MPQPTFFNFFTSNAKLNAEKIPSQLFHARAVIETEQAQYSYRRQDISLARQAGLSE